MSERAGDVTQINKNHLLKKRSVFSTAVHKKRLVVSGSFLCKWHCVRCSVVGWPLNWFISPWATVAWVLFIGSPVDNVFFSLPNEMDRKPEKTQPSNLLDWSGFSFEMVRPFEWLWLFECCFSLSLHPKCQNGHQECLKLRHISSGSTSILCVCVCVNDWN